MNKSVESCLSTTVDQSRFVERMKVDTPMHHWRTHGTIEKKREEKTKQEKNWRGPTLDIGGALPFNPSSTHLTKGNLFPRSFNRLTPKCIIRHLGNRKKRVQVVLNDELVGWLKVETKHLDTRGGNDVRRRKEYNAIQGYRGRWIINNQVILRLLYKHAHIIN